MANRPPATPVELDLTAQQLRNRISRLQECTAEVELFNPDEIASRFHDPKVMAIEAAIKGALVAAFGDQTASYRRYERAARLDWGPIRARTGAAFGRTRGEAGRTDLTEARKYHAQGKDQALTLLRQAIKSLTAILDEKEEKPAAQHGINSASVESNRRIFVVHGHDKAALQSVARFLEKIELEPIVLSEQPDRGLTIIEKFVEYAGQARFAIVLLTPDDFGASVSAATPSERARQNVIFELGFFVGQLGRGHVCLMRKGDVEIPTDLSGVIYSTLDDSEAWKLKLVQELKAAMIELDVNKLWP